MTFEFNGVISIFQKIYEHERKVGNEFLVKLSVWGENSGLFGFGVLQKVEKNEFSSMKLQNAD